MVSPIGTMCFAFCSNIDPCPKGTPFVSEVYNCLYWYKIGCYSAPSVKTYADKVEVALAGEHTASSHTGSSSILSIKQRSAVEMEVRSSPHAIGSQVYANLENFSQVSEFSLTVEARKLSHALFELSGKRLWWKGFPAWTLTAQKAV
jgi:hypothetical protein